MMSYFPFSPCEPLSPASHASLCTSSSLFSYPSRLSSDELPSEWSIDPDLTCAAPSDPTSASLVLSRDSSVALFNPSSPAALSSHHSTTHHSALLLPAHFAYSPPSPTSSPSSSPSSTSSHSSNTSLAPSSSPLAFASSLPSLAPPPSGPALSSESDAAAATATAGSAGAATVSGREEACAAASSAKPRLVSCVFCHHSKVKCSGQQPCSRCVKLDRGHLCKEWKSRVKPHTLLRPPSPQQLLQITSEDDAPSESSATPPTKRRRAEVEGDPRPSSYSSSSSSSSLSSATTLTLLPSAASCESASLSYLSVFPPSSLQPLPSGHPFRPRLSRHLVRCFLRFDRCAYKGPLPHRMLHFFRLATQINLDDLTTLIHSHHARKIHPKHLYPERDCDGTACDGMCEIMRKILTNNPTQFNFTASPSTPLEDAPINNFPVLIIHRTPNPTHAVLFSRLIAHCNATAVISGPPSTPFVLPYTVQVNRAWERLFGYSQGEVRGMYLREEWRAGYLLMRSGEWERVGWKDFLTEKGIDCIRGDERAWEGKLDCVDKWGRPFECFVVKSFIVDAEQLCQEVQWTFIASKQRQR